MKFYGYDFRNLTDDFLTIRLFKVDLRSPSEARRKLDFGGSSFEQVQLTSLHLFSLSRLQSPWQAYDNTIILENPCIQLAATFAKDGSSSG
jgi:hypothetical protein